MSFTEKIAGIRVIGFLLIFSCGLFADRPRCYELLPSRTLAYLRIADVVELGEKFNETALGKMIQQEQMQSLTSQLFDEAEVAFTPVAEEIGLSIRDLLAIPQGEICLAFVAPPSGGQVTAPVLMLDVRGQQANIQKLLELLEQRLVDEGRQATTENLGGATLKIFEDEDPRWTGVIHFRKDDLQVLTTNLDVAEQILSLWNGEEDVRSLEANQDFQQVMRYSKGPAESSPQIRWFIDPISLAKVSFRGNNAAQTGMAMLPVVGLDGLQAIGGSYTMATDDYDTFTEAHVITAEPRTGVLAALALKGGDPVPETWVPAEAASYQTLFWDVKQTKDEVQILFDSFSGEGQFENSALARLDEYLGVSVAEDIIAVVDGRLSLTSWYPQSSQQVGVIYLGGVKLKSDHDFDKTLEKIMDNVGAELERKTYGGSTYYFSPKAEQEPEAITNPFLPSSPQIAVGVVEDYLLVASDALAIERAILTKNSKKSLADELDFKLVASKLRRQPSGKTPGYFTFERPEQGLRMLYNLATAESTRNMLSGASEGNQFFRTLNDALEKNPLPPFAQLRQFVAPTGSIMTADDKGFHYTGFGLRRKQK